MSHRLPLGTQAFMWPGQPDPDAPVPPQLHMASPAVSEPEPAYPFWLQQAVDDGDIEIDDGDAFVGGHGPEHRVQPGDYVVKGPDQQFSIVKASVFCALTGSTVDVSGSDDDPDVEQHATNNPPPPPPPPTPPTPSPSPSPPPSPPYSAGVLARSETARAKQAAYERQRAVEGRQPNFNRPAGAGADPSFPADPGPADAPANPYNAAHEGAATPDEPEPDQPEPEQYSPKKGKHK
jgi:hypothetical protein